MQSSFMEGPFVDEAAIEDARVRVWVCVLALERRDIVWVVRALWALFWVPLSVLLLAPNCLRATSKPWTCRATALNPATCLSRSF